MDETMKEMLRGIRDDVKDVKSIVHELIESRSEQAVRIRAIEKTLHDNGQKGVISKVNTMYDDFTSSGERHLILWATLLSLGSSVLTAVLIKVIPWT